MQTYDWQAWTPWQVAERLAGLDVPWCVTAGWAVELFVGSATREHDDIEIAVPSAAWPQVRERLADLDFVVAGDGRLWPLDDETMADHFQTWGRDTGGTYRIDVFRDPHEGETWLCRRDPRIRRPYGELVRRTPDGIPYMTPEVVLLFKAKGNRDKDRSDLAACLPLMTASERRWLADAIELVHPGHPWVGEVLAGVRQDG